MLAAFWIRTSRCSSLPWFGETAICGRPAAALASAAAPHAPSPWARRPAAQAGPGGRQGGDAALEHRRDRDDVIDRDGAVRVRGGGCPRRRLGACRGQPVELGAREVAQ